MSVIKPLTLHPDAARESMATAVLCHMFELDGGTGECPCGFRGLAWALALHVADEAIKAATA